MLKRERDFKYSDQAEPHKERTREILTAHPEVRELISRNPNSIYIICNNSLKMSVLKTQ